MVAVILVMFTPTDHSAATFTKKLQFVTVPDVHVCYLPIDEFLTGHPVMATDVLL